MKRIILSLALAAAILSCAKEQEAEQALPVDGSERVCASAADFVCGNELTKTTITQEGTDAPKFAWKEGDIIGIVPMDNETFQSNYKISEILSDPREAMFDGGVWALKDGKEYAAYYPLKEEIARSGNSLTFSFLGQTQSANNSLAHLGAYDYMYASSVVPAAGLATFQFKHLISLIRLQLTVPATDTFTSVLLESDDACFASEASLELSTGVASASKKLKTQSINLNNIAVSEGNVLTVWFSMLPTAELKGKTLNVKLNGVESFAKASMSITNEFKAGSAYSYSCGLALAGKIEYVDLGLSVKWATCNIGETRPEEYGGFYQWGGLEDVTSTSIYLDYSNCPFHSGSNYNSGWTKYIPSSKSSFWSGGSSPDNKIALDPEDDVVYVTLGGNWRMPTDAEWTELINNCTWEWTDDYNGTGVSGEIVTSNKAGFTDKSIFLPAAGNRRYGEINQLGIYGYYWSSSVYPDSPRYAYAMRFNSSKVEISYEQGRYGGKSVRPVLADMSIHTHPLKKINVQAPTTASSGWKDYYQCSEPFCKLYFEDAGGTVSIGDETALAAWKSVGGRGYLAPITEIVDLGLSVKWRAWNLGATKPEEYGGYYQWAGLEDVTSTSIYLDYSNCPYHLIFDTSLLRYRSPRPL